MIITYIFRIRTKNEEKVFFSSSNFIFFSKKILGKKSEISRTLKKIIFFIEKIDESL